MDRSTRYDIVYSDNARRDLEQIGLYLEQQRGTEFAARYLARMRVRIESLRLNAMLFRERRELGPGARVLVETPYLIFYQVAEQTVYIQRVLHGSRKVSPAMLSD